MKDGLNGVLSEMAFCLKLLLVMLLEFLLLHDRIHELEQDASLFLMKDEQVLLWHRFKEHADKWSG